MFLITFAALILPRQSGFLRCYFSSLDGSLTLICVLFIYWSHVWWRECLSNLFLCVSRCERFLWNPLRLLHWIRLNCVVLCPGQNVLCVRTDNYVVGEIGWNSVAVSTFFQFFFNWSWLDNRLVRRQLSLRLRGVSWNKWAALKKN